jgi:hypothetical protein
LKVAVVGANREEVTRSLDRDVLIGDCAEPSFPPGRRHRHRQYDVACAMSSSYLTGRSGCRAGGDSVVDDDRWKTVHWDVRTTTSVCRRSCRDFVQLARGDLGELGVGESRLPHDVVVEHPDAVFANCSERKLWLPRHPELSDHDDVERRVQALGDFGGNRDPAPRQPEHHRISTTPRRQLPRQPLPRVVPIPESVR